jgi:hypothetical protein
MKISIDKIIKSLRALAGEFSVLSSLLEPEVSHN